MDGELKMKVSLCDDQKGLPLSGKSFSIINYQFSIQLTGSY